MKSEVGTEPGWINAHQVQNLKLAVGRLFDLMEILEPTMEPTKIVIERETAINNIAVLLLKKNLLNVPPLSDSRLEPFLTLSPIVLLISDAIDAATIKIVISDRLPVISEYNPEE